MIDMSKVQEYMKQNGMELQLYMNRADVIDDYCYEDGSDCCESELGAGHPSDIYEDMKVDDTELVVYVGNRMLVTWMINFLPTDYCSSEWSETFKEMWEELEIEEPEELEIDGKVYKILGWFGSSGKKVMVLVLADSCDDVYTVWTGYVGDEYVVWKKDRCFDDQQAAIAYAEENDGDELPEEE